LLLFKFFGYKFVTDLYFVALKFLIYKLITNFSSRINVIHRLLVYLFTQFRFFIVSDLYLKSKAVGSGRVANEFFELLEKSSPVKLLESNIDAAQSDGVVAELTLDGKFIIKKTKVNESYKFRHDEVKFERWISTKKKQIGDFLRYRPLNSKINNIQHFHFRFQNLINIIFKLTKFQNIHHIKLFASIVFISDLKAN